MKIKLLASLIIVTLLLVALPALGSPGVGFNVLFGSGGWGLGARYWFPNRLGVDLQYLSTSESGSGSGYSYSGSGSEIYPSLLYALTREGKAVPYLGLGLGLLSAQATYNFDGTILSATAAGTGFRGLAGLEFFFAENNSFDLHLGYLSASIPVQVNGYSITVSASEFVYGLGFRFYF